MHSGGIDEIVQIDHGWATSIYATDPNGIMVEFCVTTSGESFAQSEQEALRLMRQPPNEIPEATRKETGVARRV
jgi:catechol-2,3-dioxygenase